MGHRARLGRLCDIGPSIGGLTCGELTSMHLFLTAGLSSGYVVRVPRLPCEVLDTLYARAGVEEGF